MRSRLLATTIQGVLSTAALALAPLAVANPAAPAADRLEDVVVTATRRAASVQEVPLAITAITGDTLAAAGVTRIEDLATPAPNTFINTGSGLRTTTVTVRGISSNPNNPGVDPAVGVFVDGVYMSRPTTLNANLYDLERIELVRGPQGALFGKNTIAGALSLITRRPSDTPGADIRLGYGNFGAIDAYAALNGTGSDRLRGRLSASVQQRDGVIDNLTTGTELSDLDGLGVRGAVEWTPTDAVTVIFRGDYSRDRTNAGGIDVLDNGQLAGTPLADPDPWDRTVRNDRDSVQDRDVGGGSLQIDVELGAGTLTSLTSYRSFTWENLGDNDYTPLNFLSSGIEEDQNEWAQDLRFVTHDGAAFDYVVGGYLSRQTLDAVSTAFVGPALGIYPQEVTGVIFADLTTRTAAAYGQVSYDFATRWNVTAALRYSNEQKEVDHRQVGDPLQILLRDQALQTLERTDSELSPTASLSYLFADDIRGYVSVGRGFKAGGFNVFSITPTNRAEYEPEQALSYELGVKSRLSDGRVQLNAALYWLDYDDLQLNQLVLVNGVPRFTTSNAASARSRGGELELAARVTAALDLSLAYGYADATYRDFRNATPQGADFSGNRLPESARHTLATALDYSKPLTAALTLNARVDFAYRSGAFFEPDNAPAVFQGGYGLVGARLGLQAASGRWGVTVWGRNLGDREYAVSRSDGAIIPRQVIQTPGMPRTYGIEFNASF